VGRWHARSFARRDGASRAGECGRRARREANDEIVLVSADARGEATKMDRI
jgi:hypothetical protein